MSDKEPKGIFECNRRDFLKTASVGVAAMAIPAAGLIRNAGAVSLTTFDQDIIETDVLIIGGGFAGTFAAIKAKEKGVDVVLADKGYVGRSGCTPWAGSFNTYDPSGGQSRESVITQALGKDESIVRTDYLNLWLDHSKGIGEDVKSWGTVGALNHGDVFRKQLKKQNVRLIERIMITELLEKDGQVVGAVGFLMDEDKVTIIKAKAVAMCSGSGSFKNTGWPSAPNTYDGQAMAYRSGAEISGKEWNDEHYVSADNVDSVWANWGEHFNIVFGRGPGGKGRPPGGKKRPPGGGSSGGRPRGPRLTGLGILSAAHEGKVPVLVEDLLGKGVSQRGPTPTPPDTKLVLGSAIGRAPHRSDGLFPKDNKCASNIPGLFAAGDAMCTAGVGSGQASTGSSVQGAIAGVSAAEFAMKAKIPVISNAEINEAKNGVFEPRTREKGYSPAWVTQLIQSIMTPYYVLYVKKKERLEAALTNIEFLRDHFAPKLLANDAHELRLAHETRNMILNAEMKLKASLFRTESRASHYREDFPARNDSEWLAWVILRKDGDDMKLYKKSLPDEQMPDPNKTYEQRYRKRFPGEMDYIKSKKIL